MGVVHLCLCYVSQIIFMSQLTKNAYLHVQQTILMQLLSQVQHVQIGTIQVVYEWGLCIYVYVM